MSRLRLVRSGADDELPPRPADAPGQDDLPAAADPVTRELRALYAAPGERYWDDLEGRIMAAVLAGRPARVAAHWWQTMAEWARPGLAAAAVLVVVVGAVTVQARAARTGVAESAAQAAPLELQPLDPEFARAIDAATSEQSEAERAAREAAYLLTGGVKERQPVQLDGPALPAPPSVRPATPTREVHPAEEDAAVRERREATFRYLMPD